MFLIPACKLRQTDVRYDSGLARLRHMYHHSEQLPTMLVRQMASMKHHPSVSFLLVAVQTSKF